MKYKDRDDLVASLRGMADFIEEHGLELPLSSWYDMEFDITNYMFSDADRPLLRKIAKILGSAEKNFNGNYFKLEKKFGRFGTLAFEVSRQVVCERKVVEVIHHEAEVREIEAYDEEVVEWVCNDPILSAESEVVSAID